MSDFVKTDPKKYPKLGIDSVLPFGKYKGREIKEVIRYNPFYINWIVVNCSVDNELTCISNKSIQGKRNERSYSYYGDIDELSDNGQHEYDIW